MVVGLVCVRYSHACVHVLEYCARTVYVVEQRLTWLKQKLAQLGLKRAKSNRDSPSTSTRYHQGELISNPCMILKDNTYIIILQYVIHYNYCLQMELNTSNCLLGYRAMWRLLQVKHGYTVKRSSCSCVLFSTIKVMHGDNEYKFTDPLL